ncbi:adenylyltransferase and sulfurtransferase [Mucilaginibacter lappiensis]|uniref:Adenylyltransferase/sulfurtransferase n=1 Tax=Mucilaginibacter lappiensis TaxID=354630 RepID=A0ABR6PGA9_9SPHI|nr:HesA/MoeB/ThiF family protein [Mucilaginibacter lappiensis]MBB6108045.1 adenylyltransferase/sulfurtransferase [Mucilaginibacter lappiensis]SIP88695.1 adenylyltransferase and sulfurtransferase [Mucilaginibacter lappiensis]
MLEREELKLYNRQIILPELGLAGQEKLKVARVLMIGAGGLGCPVLQYLVAAGVGHVGIVDADVIDISNLHRQILYSIADVGKPKAETAKQKLEWLNPFVELTAYEERLNTENAARLINLYDLIIDGSDNFTTRYLVNDTCVALNKPLVFGSIFKFEGQVSVFNYQDGPNYRDVFPEPPPENEVPNCDETGVIGVLPGIIGTYMANEAIKIICDIGETLSGKLFSMNALDNSMNVYKITKQRQAISAPVAANLAASPDREISMETLSNWLGETPDEICIIDVRETYEFDDYNIGGLNIPLYELQESVDIIPVDKKLVFICQTGQRSKIALQWTESHLKNEKYSLKNGIKHNL